MCRACVVGYILDVDDPTPEQMEDTVWPESTPEMVALIEPIRSLYYRYPTGGPMHVVLDDYNVEDDSIDFCERDLTSFGQPEISVIGPTVDRIIELLRPMTCAQRAVAIARAHGDAPS